MIGRAIAWVMDRPWLGAILGGIAAVFASFRAGWIASAAEHRLDALEEGDRLRAEAEEGLDELAAARAEVRADTEARIEDAEGARPTRPASISDADEQKGRLDAWHRRLR